MLNIKQIVLIAFTVYLPIAAFSQSSNKNVTYDIKVIDSAAIPVEGAEVAVVDTIYDWADGRILRPVKAKKMTNSDGIANFQIELAFDADVCFVARKKGLAFSWYFLNRHALPTDGTELTIMLDKACEISGQIVDNLGKPVAGAKVHGNFSTSFPETQHEINSPEDWFTVETDDNGNFIFDNVPPDGSADFIITAKGKAKLDTSVDKSGGSGYSFSAGLNNIRLTLSPEAKIEGKVIDSSGKPVSGVKLLLRPEKAATGQSFDRTISGKDGRFFFEQVPAGLLAIVSVAQRLGTTDWVADDIKITTKEGKTTDNVVFKVNKGVFYDVVIIDADTKKPVPNLYVNIQQVSRTGGGPSFLHTLATDNEGRARFRVPSGELHFFAGGNNYSRVQEVVKVGNKSVKRRIELHHNPVYAGTVKDQSGNVVPNAIVSILPPGYGFRADNNGKFSTSWQILSEQCYFFARDEQRNIAGVAEIPDGTRHMEIELEPALSLVGNVTDPNGRPIPAARIRLYCQLAGWAAFIGEEIITDKNGLYEIPAVPKIKKGLIPTFPGLNREGIFRIYITASGYSTIKLQQIKNTVIENAVNNIAQMNPFVLQPLNMSLSGIVVDSDGKPVPNEIVSIMPGEQPLKLSITDEEGRFSFNRLAKGSLNLQAGYVNDGNSGLLRAEAGDKDVKIVLGQTGINTAQTSLVGKTLPDLSAFNVRLESQVIRNKMLLVCFWDIEQRPSRNAILSLNKRANALLEKDLYMVFINTGTVEERTFVSWLTRNEIIPPVGVSRTSLPELGYSWGVQSLPWLILTDKNHKVTAEGFPIADLDETLKN